MMTWRGVRKTNGFVDSFAAPVFVNNSAGPAPIFVSDILYTLS